MESNKISRSYKNCNYIQKVGGSKFLKEIIEKYAKKDYIFYRVHEINSIASPNYLFEIMLDYDEHLEDYYLFRINDFDVEQISPSNKYNKFDFRYLEDIKNEIRKELFDKFGEQYSKDSKNYIDKRNELKKQLEEFELEY